MILALIVAGAVETLNPPAGNSSGAGIAWIIGAALGGSGLAYLGQLLFRRQTKDKLISEASNEVAEGARTLLAEYRQELKDARAETIELRERIVRLETELATAKAAREVLQHQLEEAIERRSKLEQATHDLQERIRQIEGTVERRQEPPTRRTSR